jgi:hypothetical protein
MPDISPLSRFAAVVVSNTYAEDAVALRHEPDLHIAQDAHQCLVQTVEHLRDLHGRAVDPRLRALLDGAADTVRELAATVTEHSAGTQVAHRP